MADYSAIDLDLLAQEGMLAFRAALTPANVFSTSMSDEVKDKGESVNVPIIGEATANTFDGDGYEKDGGAVTNAVVNLTQHLVSSFPITDTQAHKGNRNHLLQQAGMHGKAVAKLALTTVWADITTANWPTPAHTGTASNFDSDDVIDIRTACTAANMPKEMRSLVLDDSYIGNLLKDTHFKNVLNVQDTGPAREGVIGRAFGFNVYESTIIPSNSQNLVGFACVPSAYALAARLPDPDRNSIEGFKRAVNYRAMVDDETGMALGMRVHADEKLGKLWVSFEIMFGFKKVIAAALKRITSATT